MDVPRNLVKTFARDCRGLATGGILLVLAATSAPAETTPAPKARKNDVAPLPASEKAASTHDAYDPKDCSACHKNADPKDPGPVTTAGPALCVTCHEEAQKALALKFPHGAAKENCVNCHNPHNARHAKLLTDDAGALCLGCHTALKQQVTDAKVKHDALTTGAQCLNCHHPHGSAVEHLLRQEPIKLCLGCHNRDDLADHAGQKLVNLKQLLDQNPVKHAPVAADDCTSCHNPHGSQVFRLLKNEYPARFYAAFDPKAYALCFDCHDQALASTPETTSETRFRNGSKNLHFVHVDKTDHGRTCRVCHEVHAAKQEHLLRESVPFGPNAWPLKLNYTKTPTGGSCQKTCHATRNYDNSGEVNPAKNK